ncbi:MAG: hypothetical protein GY755_17385, partial [Chloroflexi bacterium]|nr:hypothetical protein [Chloroflexota bacterium]
AIFGDFWPFLPFCTFVRPKKRCGNSGIFVPHGFLDFRNIKEAKKPCGTKMPLLPHSLLDPLSARKPKNRIFCLSDFWPFLAIFAILHFREAKKKVRNSGIFVPHGFQHQGS